MKFLIVLAIVGLAAADVSHLTSNYLPPKVSTPVVNYNQVSDATISRPIVSTYTTQQQLRPEISYSRQVNVVPSVQVIGGGYDSGFNGNGLIHGGGLVSSDGYYGNTGLINAYDSGLSGLSGYSGYSGLSGLSGGIIDSGYNSGLNGLVGGGLVGGGLVGGGLVGGGLVGGGLVGSGLVGGSNIVRTISAPAVSNVYESSLDTQYGSNGGYVYDKKH